MENQYENIKIHRRYQMPIIFSIFRITFCLILIVALIFILTLELPVNIVLVNSLLFVLLCIVGYSVYKLIKNYTTLI